MSQCAALRDPFTNSCTSRTQLVDAPGARGLTSDVQSRDISRMRTSFAAVSRLTPTELSHIVVLVRDDVRMSDNGRGHAEKPREELTPGMGGRWLVTTLGSSHEWDLDAMTYMRMPSPVSRSGPFPMDGQPMPITRIGRWPRIGSTSLIWYDDPAEPSRHEHWRQSSTILSIAPLPDVQDKAPDPSGGGCSDPASLGVDGNDR
jgi:hypothetical protein